jgi:hypothetical protein
VDPANVVILQLLNEGMCRLFDLLWSFQPLSFEAL